MGDENIGFRFKELRKFWGLSQAEAGKKFSTSMKSWQRFEGGTVPREKTLVSIARSGVNVNWLLAGEGPMLRADSEAARSALPDSAEPMDVPSVTGDPQLMGRLVESILRVYKEIGGAITPRQAAEMASPLHDRIVQEVSDREDRIMRAGEYIAELRQQLVSETRGGLSSRKRST